MSRVVRNIKWPRKGDDSAEQIHPRKFQDGQPIRLGIELSRIFGPDVGSPLKNLDHDKAGIMAMKLRDRYRAFSSACREKNSENGARRCNHKSRAQSE